MLDEKGGRPKTVITKGVRCESNLVWLRRSIVGEGLSPLMPREVRNCLKEVGINIVKAVL